MPYEVLLLGEGDADVLANVAPGAFDNPIDSQGTAAFLKDDRHHLVVAVTDGLVVGFVSAVHYVNPDRPLPEMWVNEVQVAPGHRRKGLARAMLERMIHRARELSCTEAWVLTEADNGPATSLYEALGGVVEPEGGTMFSFDPSRGPRGE